MHLLRKSEAPPEFGLKPSTQRRIAGVCVQHEQRGRDDVLVITEVGDLGCLIVLKLGIGVWPLPDRVKVFNPEGEEIKPEHKFWVTTETFNPYHIVLDTDQP